MTKLIPLSDIPYAARSNEAHERAKWPTRAMALDAASYEIVAALGCYGGADAPSYGWVLTRAAAVAISAQLTHMPGGTSHRERDYRQHACSSEALGEYMEAIARGMPQADALAAYDSARG